MSETNSEKETMLATVESMEKSKELLAKRPQMSALSMKIALCEAIRMLKGFIDYTWPDNGESK